MKTITPLLLSLLLPLTSLRGQGTLQILPVAVTNGVTGTLADSSFLAALYYGSASGSEASLVPLLPAAPLVNGFAQFGSATTLPGFPGGSTVLIEVRAWSSPYATYESAVASGLNSVLAGKSVLALATLETFPTPPPGIIIPGFTVEPVPEPSNISLGALIAVLFWLARRVRRRHRLLTTSSGVPDCGR